MAEPQPLSACTIPHLPGTAYYVPDFLTPAEEAYLLDKFRSRPASAFRNLSRRRLQVYPAALDPRTNVLPAGPLPDWIERPVVERLLRAPEHAARPDEAAAAAVAAAADGLAPDGKGAVVRHVFRDAPHGRPTHALLNEYPPGVGIAAHEDGPAYYPTVCTFSLGSHTVLELQAKPSSPSAAGEATSTARPAAWRLLQEPRSLLVLGRELYEGHLHAIGDRAADAELGPCGDDDGGGRGGGVVNWELLAPATRAMLREQGGHWARGTRVSITLRDVWKTRDLGRLLPGLGPGRR